MSWAWWIPIAYGICSVGSLLAVGIYILAVKLGFVMVPPYETLLKELGVPTVKFTRRNESIEPPTRGTNGAAGWDVRSTEELILHSGVPAVVSTGLSVEIPQGYELQIRPRGGMGSRGITIPNSPGTVDSDYRGEVGIILLNQTESPYIVKKGDRIAQLVLQEVPEIEWKEVNELSPTRRGSEGFGSTGR